MPPFVFDRLRKKGFELPSLENIWIVGDTVKDVLCAKANNLSSLITLTGYSSPEEIEASEPTIIIEDLKSFPREILGIT